MIELYIESDKFGKSVIFSLLSKDHSKREVMNYFNCSKRKIDESRKIQKVSEGIKIPEITKYTRSKLDLITLDKKYLLLLLAWKYQHQALLAMMIFALKSVVSFTLLFYFILRYGENE